MQFSSLRQVVAVLLAAVFVLLLLNPQPVHAHAVPVSAEPALNGSVESAPEMLVIQFNEPVVPTFSTITLLSQSGQEVQTGELQVLDERATRLGLLLPPLNNGTYLVSWAVLSGVDGHNTSGTYPIGVGVDASSMNANTVSTRVTWPTFLTAGARWLMLTGLALLLGLFVFQLFIWLPIYRREIEEEADDDASEGVAQLHTRASYRGAQFGLLGVALLLVGSLLTLVDQSAKFDLTSLSNFSVWSSTRFGLMWTMRAILVLALGAVTSDLYRNYRKAAGRNSAILPPATALMWWLGLALSLAVALTVSLVSHSAALVTDDMPLAVAVDLLHVLGASIWVGGLLQLALVLWQTRQLDDESRLWISWNLILNFSALAAASVGALAVTGGFLGWKHVGSWTLLFGTAYGLLLLAKVGVALPAFAIAGVNLLWIKPRLDEAFDESANVAEMLQARFRRFVQVEAVFALLVLVGAGILTDLQRSVEAPLLSESPGELVLSRRAEDVNVTFALEPALVGQNQFDIVLADQNGQPVDNASEVALTFMYLGQSMGSSEAVAEPAGDGRYTVSGGFLSLVGPWQVEVAVRRPDSFDAFAPFRIESGFTGAFRSFDVRPGPLERVTQWVNQYQDLVNGAGMVLFALLWLFIASRAAARVWQFAVLLVPVVVAFWFGFNGLYVFYDEYTPTKFAVNPMLPDAESIARGQQLYEDNCVQCHGLQGYGDGAAAAALPIQPANFTGGHTSTHPDGDIYHWVKEGIPESGMPAWGEKFDDADIWHIVNYVRRLSNGRQLASSE